MSLEDRGRLAAAIRCLRSPKCRPCCYTVAAVSRQKLGQHFLVDAGWRARIAGALRASKEDVWLEIGAGHGEMTAELARSGARITAIELDPTLCERLRSRAADWPNVETVRDDFLALDLGSLLGDTERVRVYGNLPYYVTSPILRRLFEYADRLASIHVVTQFEVAARLVARAGSRDYGYLSVLTQFYSRPEMVLRVPPEAFRPRPKVTSALVSLELPGLRMELSVADERNFLEFAKACFAQKRKTLRNNLRPLVGTHRAQEGLRAAGLRADARAEQLSLAQFAELHRRLVSG